MAYKIYKIKNNIYVVKYLFCYKILKISFDDYYIEKYKIEFENYKKLLSQSNNTFNIEKFNKIIYLENISSKDYFEFFILDNKIQISFTNFNYNLPGKTNFVCLISDFNPKNLTFDKIIEKYGYNNIDAYMYNILFNRYKAASLLNFKHCDFKINNILILENGDASLFDLDFSVFVKNNHYIDIYNYDVNLYLDMPDSARISGNFLDIFDNYLLGISIIYTRGSFYAKVILSKMKRFVFENNNVPQFYKLFIVIFANLLEYCHYKLSIEEYNTLLKYSQITKILNDSRKINIGEIYNSYTYSFDFIEKTLLQICIMNISLNKYILN